MAVSGMYRLRTSQNADFIRTGIAIIAVSRLGTTQHPGLLLLQILR